MIFHACQQDGLVWSDPARVAREIIQAVKFDRERPDRRSFRLKNYDYSRRPAAYFVTVCVRKRLCLFGNVLHGEMVLNEFGTIVRDEWLKTAEIRDNIEMDDFVVMPNHVHGILFITGFAGTARRAPAPFGGNLDISTA
jgi:putative transposase